MFYGSKSLRNNTIVKKSVWRVHLLLFFKIPFKKEIKTIFPIGFWTKMEIINVAKHQKESLPKSLKKIAEKSSREGGGAESQF